MIPHRKSFNLFTEKSLPGGGLFVSTLCKNKRVSTINFPVAMYESKVKKEIMKLLKLIITGLLCTNLNIAFAGETIRIAVGEWPPFLHENVKDKGIAARIIEDIFVSEGYDVTFDFLPWPRAYALSKTGKYHGTAVWVRKPERETDFYYSEPVIQEKHVFFHLKSEPFEWRSLEDLLDLKLGGLLGFSYGKELDGALEEGKINMERVGRDKQNYAKLIKKRIEIYPQEINVGYYALKKHFSPEEVELVTHHFRPFMVRSSHLLLARQIEENKDLLIIFNRGLRKLKNSKRYRHYFNVLLTPVNGK